MSKEARQIVPYLMLYVDGKDDPQGILLAGINSYIRRTGAKGRNFLAECTQGLVDGIGSDSLTLGEYRLSLVVNHVLTGHVFITEAKDVGDDAIEERLSEHQAV